MVVDTCSKCGDILLDGPEEPVYRIVASKLPSLVSMTQWLRKNTEGKADGYAVDSEKIVTVMATHKIRPGKEAEFKEGEIATMEGLMATNGVVGYQILKRIGLSTLGSGHATVESIMEDMKDSSGNKLKRTAEVWEGYTIPAEYLVMVEWESLCAAQAGMPHVNVKPELLFIHGPKVLDNCLHMPSLRISDSMFREQTYPNILNGNK